LTLAKKKENDSWRRLALPAPLDRWQENQRKINYFGDRRQALGRRDYRQEAR
jgi:hypothetical protein